MPRRRARRRLRQGLRSLSLSVGRSHRGDITDAQQWLVEINLAGEGATYRLVSSWQRRGLAGPGDRLTRVGGPP